MWLSSPTSDGDEQTRCPTLDFVGLDSRVEACDICGRTVRRQFCDRSVRGRRNCRPGGTRCLGSPCLPVRCRWFNASKTHRSGGTARDPSSRRAWYCSMKCRDYAWHSRPSRNMWTVVTTNSYWHPRSARRTSLPVPGAVRTEIGTTVTYGLETARPALDLPRICWLLTSWRVNQGCRKRARSTRSRPSVTVVRAPGDALRRRRFRESPETERPGAASAPVTLRPGRRPPKRRILSTLSQIVPSIWPTIGQASARRFARRTIWKGSRLVAPSRPRTNSRRSSASPSPRLSRAFWRYFATTSAAVIGLSGPPRW